MDGLPGITPAQAETYIKEAMAVLEHQGLFVSRIMLTPQFYVLIGQPAEFCMARVSVGLTNMVMSDPEFFGFEPILFDGSRRKTSAEQEQERLWSILKDWRIWLIIVGTMVCCYLLGRFNGELLP